MRNVLLIFKSYRLLDGNTPIAVRCADNGSHSGGWQPVFVIPSSDEEFRQGDFLSGANFTAGIQPAKARGG